MERMREGEPVGQAQHQCDGRRNEAACRNDDSDKEELLRHESSVGKRGTPRPSRSVDALFEFLMSGRGDCGPRACGGATAVCAREQEATEFCGGAGLLGTGMERDE